MVSVVSQCLWRMWDTGGVLGCMTLLQVRGNLKPRPLTEDAGASEGEKVKIPEPAVKFFPDAAVQRAVGAMLDRIGPGMFVGTPRRVCEVFERVKQSL
ncbi:hypothetical protein RB213_015615 [Colletotrichum asianum]